MRRMDLYSQAAGTGNRMADDPRGRSVSPKGLSINALGFIVNRPGLVAMENAIFSNLQVCKY
jgi:hypothetical protein